MAHLAGNLPHGLPMLGRAILPFLAECMAHRDTGPMNLDFLGKRAIIWADEFFWAKPRQ
jgi:hypothetical protein